MMLWTKKKRSEPTGLNTMGVPIGWTSATVQKAEENRARFRPRDQQATRILELATGIAHICCSQNAEVCAATPLNLYRRKKAAGIADRRVYKGRPLSKIERKYLGLGLAGAGVKAAGVAETGGEVEEVMGHPLLDLMANPNPLMTGTHFDWLRFYFKQMCGNAYEEKVHEEGGVAMRLQMFPQYTLPMPDSEDFLVGYRYGRSETEARDLPVEIVAHFKHKPSRFTPYLGEGSMVGVLPEAQQVIDNIMFELASVQEGHMPPGVFSVDAMTTDEQLASIKDELDRQMRGIRGKVKALVLKGMTSYAQLNQTPRELQSMEKQDQTERRIRTAFGHTESMADSNASTKAAAIVGHSEQYLGGTIRPIVNSDADELNMLYLEDFGLDPEVYFLAYENPVPRDAQMEEERQTKMVSMGVVTVNEARAELGLDPYEGEDKEAADRLLINGMPIGQSPASADPFASLFGGRSTQTEEPDPEDPEGEEAEQSGETPVEGEQEQEKGAFAIRGAQLVHISASGDESTVSRATVECDGKELGKVIDYGINLIDECSTPLDLKALMLTKEAPQWDDSRSCGCGWHTKDDDDDIAINRLLREMMQQHEPGLRETMRDILTDMQNDALRAVADGKQPDLSEHIDQAQGELINAMKPIAEAGVRNVLEELGAGEDAFSVVPQRAIAFLEQHAAVVAEDIAGTTSEMVNTVVQAGLEHGLSIDDIASEITGVPEYRAERIARTEVQSAVQGGKYAGFKESGVKETVWRNAPGASAAHQQIAARSPKPMGEPYVKAGEEIAGEKFKRDVYMPPARPNCRCDLQPVLEDE